MNRKPNNNRDDKFATARRWLRGLGCVAVLLHAIAGPAIAGSFDGAMGNTNYVAMTGDVNNDGQNDVLMKAVPKIVMIPIDDDMDVPIPIPAPSPSFVLLSTGYGTYSLLTNPDVEMIGWAGWTAASQEITYAGPNGEFAASVKITAAAPEQASFVVSMAADTGHLQITSTTAPAVDTASGGTGSPSPSTENYTYDAIGRLRMVTYPTGEQVTYAYDGAGNRTSSSITKSALPPP
jgi:YD repeat-containing protein